MERFQEMAKEAGICEASTDKVLNNDGEEAFDRVIDTLMETKNARVVVCFCEGWTIRGLLLATKRKNAVGHFLFIGRSVCFKCFIEMLYDFIFMVLLTEFL